MSKPREFWIAAKNNGKFDAFEMPCDDYSGFHRAARVIEKSAYENLEAKLKIATEALAEGAEFYKIDDVNGQAGEICKDASDNSITRPMRAHYLTTIEWFNLNTCILPICKVFGYQVFLVGSAIHRRDFRDVDVRVIWGRFEGILDNEHGRKVVGMMMSEWLSSRTGLVIDFQIQTMAEADEHKGPRYALGTTI